MAKLNELSFWRRAMVKFDDEEVRWLWVYSTAKVDARIKFTARDNTRKEGVVLHIDSLIFPSYLVSSLLDLTNIEETCHWS